jgi:hypothetical protein
MRSACKNLRFLHSCKSNVCIFDKTFSKQAERKVPTVRSHSNMYKVDKFCAVMELRILGIEKSKNMKLN